MSASTRVIKVIQWSVCLCDKYCVRLGDIHHSDMSKMTAWARCAWLDGFYYFVCDNDSPETTLLRLRNGPGLLPGKPWHIDAIIAMILCRYLLW